MLLTPAEVSQRLRVSLRMVYALMADGSITADSSALLYACLRCGSAACSECSKPDGRADCPSSSAHIKGRNMMHIGNGKRDQWEFEYTAAKLAEGAIAQREFRRGRAAWWANAKDQLMTEIRQSGLEVSESVAAGISNYTGTRMEGPQVMVRADLQKKLSECHAKIQSHQQAADEYEGWVQVLKANSENRLKLTQADWLYFFGAH